MPTTMLLMNIAPKDYACLGRANEVKRLLAAYEGLDHWASR